MRQLFLRIIQFFVIPPDFIFDLNLRRIGRQLTQLRQPENRPLQSVPDTAITSKAAQMNMKLPHGIPGIADHLIDDLIKCRIRHARCDQVNDCLQPVKLIAVGRILQHQRKAVYIQRIIIRRINF